MTLPKLKLKPEHREKEGRNFSPNEGRGLSDEEGYKVKTLKDLSGEECRALKAEFLTHYSDAHQFGRKKLQQCVENFVATRSISVDSMCRIMIYDKWHTEKGLETAFTSAGAIRNFNKGRIRRLEEMILKIQNEGLRLFSSLCSVRELMQLLPIYFPNDKQYHRTSINVAITHMKKEGRYPTAYPSRDTTASEKRKRIQIMMESISNRKKQGTCITVPTVVGSADTCTEYLQDTKVKTEKCEDMPKILHVRNKKRKIKIIYEGDDNYPACLDVENIYLVGSGAHTSAIVEMGKGMLRHHVKGNEKSVGQEVDELETGDTEFKHWICSALPSDSVYCSEKSFLQACRDNISPLLPIDSGQ